MAVDLGPAAAAAPDQVRLEADDRIPPARRAALHAFQQEGVGLAVGELEEGGDRGFEVGDPDGPGQRAAPGIVGRAEGGEAGAHRRPADAIGLPQRGSAAPTADRGIELRRVDAGVGALAQAGDESSPPGRWPPRRAAPGAVGHSRPGSARRVRLLDLGERATTKPVGVCTIVACARLEGEQRADQLRPARPRAGSPAGRSAARSHACLQRVGRVSAIFWPCWTARSRVVAASSWRAAAHRRGPVGRHLGRDLVERLLGLGGDVLHADRVVAARCAARRGHLGQVRRRAGLGVERGLDQLGRSAGGPGIGAGWPEACGPGRRACPRRRRDRGRSAACRADRRRPARPRPCWHPGRFWSAARCLGEIVADRRPSLARNRGCCPG